MPVAVGVEAVAGGAPGGCWDWCGGAEVGEGGFVSEPVDVLAGGDEQGAGVGDADAEEGGRVWGCNPDELLELCVEFGDLVVEVADSAGEAAQAEFRSVERLAEPCAVGA